MASQTEESAELVARTDDVCRHCHRSRHWWIQGVAGEAGLKFLYVRLREIVENPSATDDLQMAARCRAKDRLAVPAMIGNHVSLYRELSK